MQWVSPATRIDFNSSLLMINDYVLPTERQFWIILCEWKTNERLDKINIDCQI